MGTPLLRRSTAFGHQTIALMFRLRDPPKRDSEANLRCRPWVKPLLGGRTSASAECSHWSGGQSAAQFCLAGTHATLRKVRSDIRATLAADPAHEPVLDV